MLFLLRRVRHSLRSHVQLCDSDARPYTVRETQHKENTGEKVTCANRILRRCFTRVYRHRQLACTHTSRHCVPSSKRKKDGVSKKLFSASFFADEISNDFCQRPPSSSRQCVAVMGPVAVQRYDNQMHSCVHPKEITGLLRSAKYVRYDVQSNRGRLRLQSFVAAEEGELF